MDEKLMQILMARLKAFFHDDRGITIVEYAIGAGLITSVIVAALTALGVSIAGILLTLTAFLAP